MFMILLSTLPIIIYGAELPPGIPLCHRSDPNFIDCLANGIEVGAKILAKGNKALGFPSIDPFFIDKINIMGAATTNAISMDQTYKNVEISGLPNSKYKWTSINLDDKKCGWDQTITTPIASMAGDYELKGSVLVFSINAKGKFKFTLSNMVHRHVMTCEKYEKNGKAYLKLTNYTMDIQANKAVIEFTNLFPENEQIAAEILKTVNENSLVIIKEIKPPFEKAFSHLVINGVNKIFSKVPMDEIFLK